MELCEGISNAYIYIESQYDGSSVSAPRRILLQATMSLDLTKLAFHLSDVPPPPLHNAVQQIY